MLKDWFKNLSLFGAFKQSNEVSEVFTNLDEKETKLVNDNSVIRNSVEHTMSHGYDNVSTFTELIHGNVSLNKYERLKQYRSMAAFPEINDAIDEICDACINFDETDKCIALKISGNNSLDENQRKVLDREFDDFISLYNFEKNGIEYFRNFMINGEQVWENVIDFKNPKRGIVGVRPIPTETYEYVINVLGDYLGIIFNADVISDTTGATQTGISNSIFNMYGMQNISGQYKHKDDKKNIVILPKNQLTVIETGIYSADKRIIYPLLERARRAYRQLVLLEDAILIYRLVRAPERLVFNINTGKLPARAAEHLVQKMMQRYQTKKLYNPETGDVVNGYNPHSMLESYWFPKSELGGETTVTTLQTGQNLGELADLKYFLRKLYISLKIPYNRFSEDTGEIYSRSDTMTPEDLRFSKYIMRIQNRFAKGLEEAFIVHLKLRGLWDKYKLYSRLFTIRFNPPTAYDLYHSQQMFKIKIENYETVTSHEEFSKELAMIKYLGMTEIEIAENNKRIEKEALQQAMLNKKIENVQANGLPSDMPVNDLTGDYNFNQDGDVEPAVNGSNYDSKQSSIG